MRSTIVTFICGRLSENRPRPAFRRIRFVRLSEDVLTTLNHKFELACRPAGLPKRSDWKYAEEPVREVRDGELLVKILYISLDPAMRGWCNESKSYVPPGGIGGGMRAGGLGRVAEAKHPDFTPGELVSGMFGVRRYALSDGRGG